MRFQAALLVLSTSLALACSEGGTGVGTAAPDPQDCPASPDEFAGKPCSGLAVCAYPLCTPASCPTTTKVLSCSGSTGATWQLSVPGDAGTFADANLPDTRVDDTGSAESSTEASSDATAEASSDGSSEAASDAAPDAAPEAASDDAAPEAASADAADAD